MTKQLRHQVLSLHNLLTSNDFWYGVVDGFTPQKFIFKGCDIEKLRGESDSSYEAWVDVGNVLTRTMSEFDDDAAVKTSAEKELIENHQIRAN